MLKITPYLGIFVVIVSIVGLWYPILGYMMPLVILILMVTSVSKGRWFCGNLCPRGSFIDFWVGKATLKKKIPGFLKSFWIRIPVFLMLMGFMTYRIINVINTQGIINQIGMIFVVMCLVTTAIALVLGVGISPRTWCTFCPMGTAQNLIGGKKYQLKVIDSKCIDCNKCEKVCPMQLDVHTGELKPDCIKCERCVDVCPTKALEFKA
ncbi:4Fe-4S binding protein [Methanolobus sp. ZRKC3]|uniref:4Fe-4S binding protein n=1 Tax=Methanolobus sp. ZRKC3 TaxID=3125786 RepID=UPI003251B554